MAKTSKVTTPVAGYSGVVAGVTFVDGKGETDDPAALAYFRRRGYTVDGTSTRDAGDSEPADPRNVGEQTAGTRLRDAAVDPKSSDFLPPANAGQENPHGPKVVSPQVHGREAPKAGVVPGPVPDDPEGQDAKEAAAAQAATGNPEQPAGNASKDAWHTYAVAQGKTAEELDGLTRDDIRGLFAQE